jgi:HAD superfamily hydrolase (TIGR01509 family)
MTPPIEAFLFDMGDVLIKFSHVRLCTQVADVLGTPAEAVRDYFMAPGVMAAYDRGDLSDDEMMAAMDRLAGRPVDRGRLTQAVADIFEPSPGMLEVLTELKRRGYRMVLLSNTCKPHIELVRETFPIYHLLDDYVLSYEVRAVKPEPAIYEAALAKVGVSPERVFYTDDIPAYVEAARSFGIQAEVFTGVETLRRQLADRGIEL